MKIFFWAADRQGCGHYRGELPLTALAAAGHATWLDMAMPEAVRDGEADVVVAQRTCLPGASALFQRMAADGRSKMVYELDDDLFAIDPANRRAHAYYGQGAAHHTAVDLDGHAHRIAYIDDNLRHRMIDNIRAAHLVTVTTEPLADLVSQWNERVVILPNMVPAALLQRPAPEPGARVTLGWGGSPSHTRDFGELARPLKRVLQRFGDATEFHCVGADYTHRCASRRGRTRFSTWSATVQGYYDTVDFDIGLAPLRPGRFNDAKSDVKLLEYAALGIPAVASNVGPYARSGAPVVLVDGHAWEAPLVELIQHPDQRAEYSKLARDWAATRTIEANAWRWETAYKEA